MERYRNIVKIEKVKDFLEKGKQKEALSLAKEIKPEKLKSIMDVCALGECFFVNGCYEEAKRCYKQAYDMNPTRKVLVAMINLSIRTKNVEEAKFYIDKFETAAPGDYNKFVYRYNLLRMQKRPVAELIAVLKELCEFEYIDKWAYELVKLYHKAGMKKECLEECENIILWFGYGEYVEKTNALIAYYKGELNPRELVNSRQEQNSEISEISEVSDVSECSEVSQEADSEADSTEDYSEEDSEADSTEDYSAEEDSETDSTEDYSAEADSEADSTEDYSEEEDSEADSTEDYSEEEDSEADSTEDYSAEEDSETEALEAGSADTEGYATEDSDIVSAERIEEARRRHLEETEKRAAEEEKKQQEAKERREELKRRAEEDDRKFEETLLQIIDDENIQKALSEIGISPIKAKTDTETGSESEAETDAEPKAETVAEQEKVSETEAGTEAEIETDSELKAGTDTELKAETNAETEAENIAEVSETEVGTDTELKAETNAETEAENIAEVSETETGTDTELKEEAIVGLEVEDSAETEAGTDTDSEAEILDVEQLIMENSVFSDLPSLLRTPEPAYDSRLARALRKGSLSLEEAVGIYTDFESLGAQYVRCMEILLNPKASGMGIVVSGPDKCGKSSLIKGMGKLLSMAERVESSGVMVVEADKLNEIDLEKKLPKLEGHAVLINHAGKINADTAESMARLQNRIESSTVLILEDERAAITALFRSNPKLNKAFSNRINMESVSLEMLFRYTARYMIKKEYKPDSSAAIRLEQQIRKYYEEDRANCLAKTAKLVRQTIKNADNRCAKVLLEYSTDGKLAELDMSLIKGEDVSETEI